MRYLPPFELIRRSIEISTVRGELRINVSYEDFIGIVKKLLQGVDVDDAWYVKTYEDIGTAIQRGQVPSAQRHFVEDGYFEGRLPFMMAIDEAWYLRQYPDVAQGVAQGAIASAQEHFNRDGYREGRLPFGL